MGVEKLILPISDLGEKSYSSSSLYKDGEYRSILLDGAAQSGKTGVSECILTEGVEKAIEEAGEGEKLLMDNVIGAVNLSSLSLQGKRVILAIGPERGWSERERDIFLPSVIRRASMERDRLTLTPVFRCIIRKKRITRMCFPQSCAKWGSGSRRWLRLPQRWQTEPV